MFFSTWEEFSHRRNVTSCGGNSCPKTKNVIEKLIGALKIKDFMTSFYDDLLFCICVAAWEVLSILPDFVLRAVKSLHFFQHRPPNSNLLQHKTQANNSRKNSQKTWFYLFSAKMEIFLQGTIFYGIFIDENFLTMPI